MKPITVSAILNAPIEKVWECWTNPEHIKKWNFASDEWECPGGTNDVTVGGKFSITMAAKDGSASFEFEGTYNAVEKYRRLEYVMPDGRKVHVMFASEHDGTKIVEAFDPETENPLELQRQGWQAILDNFKKYVER